jgi:hypothetical protein
MLFSTSDDISQDTDKDRLLCDCGIALAERRFFAFSYSLFMFTPHFINYLGVVSGAKRTPSKTSNNHFINYSSFR